MLEFKFEVRDPIYGFIPFTVLEQKVISDPAFQRLRRIGQLAVTHYIYPGATHTRFSHSLGVMHMASLMFDSIVNSSRESLREEFGFNDGTIDIMHQTVRLAALLHDIGHGPFSHASESVMPHNPNTGKQFNHEEYTVSIIKSRFESVFNNSPDRISVGSITDLIDRKGMVLGDYGLFFKSIVSSQLDADRADYLLRDSYHCGVKYGVYDHARLVKSLMVGFDQDGYARVGIKEESWQIAESIVLARYWIHSYVYFHKTRRVLDYHLREAIKHVYDGDSIPGPDRIDDYLALDDGSIWEKFKLNKNNRHCDAILNRNHFRLIYSTNQSQSDKDNEKFEAVRKALEDDGLEIFVDDNASTYYKSDSSESTFSRRDRLFDPKEIFIINDEKKCIPLAERSSFLSKMANEIKVRGIYIQSEFKGRAKQIIRGIV